MKMIGKCNPLLKKGVRNGLSRPTFQRCDKFCFVMSLFIFLGIKAEPPNSVSSEIKEETASLSTQTHFNKRGSRGSMNSSLSLIHLMKME